MKGFWNPLEILLNDLEAKKMIRGDYRRLIKFTDEMPEI
jgi:hypothetical protein